MNLKRLLVDSEGLQKTPDSDKRGDTHMADSQEENKELNDDELDQIAGGRGMSVSTPTGNYKGTVVNPGIGSGMPTVTWNNPGSGKSC